MEDTKTIGEGEKNESSHSPNPIPESKSMLCTSQQYQMDQKDKAITGLHVF